MQVTNWKINGNEVARSGVYVNAFGGVSERFWSGVSEPSPAGSVLRRPF